MPSKKTIKETENIVKQGKQNLNVYWLNMKAYQMLPGNEIVFASGGIEIDSETELVKAFCVRNKKTYHHHIITAQIEYNEVFKFGKYTNKRVSEVKELDLQYLKWVRDNYSFKIGEEKLKNEIINILK